MNKIFRNVKDNPLFQGIAYTDFNAMLECMSAKVRSFNRDEVILLSGDNVKFVGLVLSGSVHVIKEDLHGRVTILDEIGVSGAFGEVFACAGVSHSPVTVIAVEDSEILTIDYRRIITACSSACQFHVALIGNMLRLIASKNLLLNQKIDILSKRTTREKLLHFFDIHRGAASKFTIPYNREELAHYLCVDRSAMSSELCKMRDEGLITFNKNQFEIK
ncbi:MAG: Crp/Fnr family transcriptional regulator [Deferribacteraceae bacterium]|nr:Crp/Fnr family transcriptional regulator [Deferribacteraceae bacterium]